MPANEKNILNVLFSFFLNVPFVIFWPNSKEALKSVVLYKETRDKKVWNSD